MLDFVLNKVVETVRQRDREGVCRVTVAPSPAILEDVVMALADRLDAASALPPEPVAWRPDREAVAAIIDANKFEAWTVDRANQMADAILALPAATETGWLVESDDKGPLYHTASSTTRDAAEALRFSRQQDAEAFIKAHGPNHYSSVSTPAWRAVEHRWG